MPFLTEPDYAVQVRAEIKTLITQGSPAALQKAELAAQAEMESYLNARYNVASIFEAENEDRNPIVMLYLIDIVLYHLHSNISPRNIPELRGIRYDAAIKWLRMISKGEINPSLPLLPGNDSVIVKQGSNPKTSQRW